MKQKIKRTNDEWQRIFQQRIASGLPVRKWCDANGISYEAYKYWEQKLRQRPAEVPVSAGPSFVEIHTEEAPVSASGILAGTDWPFCLSFRGLHLSIASGADPVQLQGLLKALKEIC